MRIHIYNPEHDYALASGSPFYIPPAEVCALRDRNPLAPLLWADAGDAIVLPDNVEEDRLEPTPGIKLLHVTDLPELLATHPDAVIDPWGWDSAVRRMLARNGVSDNFLPPSDWISALRSLSHRRTTILFNELLNKQLERRGLKRHIAPLPTEFSDSVTALEWYRRQGEVFFKAPWSSAGRGILRTTELEAEKHIEPWLRGIIRRQGSVMGEELFHKKMDFATEWYVGTNADGTPDVRYLGPSVFNASGRGKYHNQISATKGAMNDLINATAPDFGDAFIEAQGEALRSMVAAMPKEVRYNGYVGIDMMADEKGTIRGGVELNFRHTMGIPPLDILILGTGNVGRHLYGAFAAAGLRVGIVSGRAEVHPAADLYLIAVKDEAILEVASRMDKTAVEGSVIAHTSGSVSIESLQSAFREKTRMCGVVYPLQTFSAGVGMDYAEIPFLVEGSSTQACTELMDLARKVSRNVREANSEVRGMYHVAAVLTCNFSNHLCTLADKFLSSEGLDFKMLLPLLKQTVSKLGTSSPSDAQTGPAARGDISVINFHLDRLAPYPEIARIYETLTRSILASTEHHNTQDLP